MSKVKILIVEDELIIAEDLKDILESLDYEVCGIAISAREALQLLEEHAPDLALLDIQIKGGKDGIELANEINMQFKIPFIFLSSHADASTLERAKKVRPFGYLVKPFQEKDIHTTIEMALNNFAIANNSKATAEINPGFVLNDSLFVRNNSMLVKLKFSDILYLEADANYSNIFAKDKKYVIRSTLKDLEAKLEGHHFSRIHKSFLINLNAIDAIEAHSVHVGGQEIPISRTQHSWLLNQITTL